MSNEGHLTPEDCRRNAEACLASERSAMDHAERCWLIGADAAHEWWLNYATQAKEGAAFWKAQESVVSSPTK